MFGAVFILKVLANRWVPKFFKTNVPKAIRKRLQALNFVAI